MHQRVDEMILGLRAEGKRITPQRTAICRLLADADTHPTANQIFKQLKPEFPSLSLATVYNTLDTLVSLGLVNILGTAGDEAVHYDADINPHVNLACVNCHRVFDLPSQYINQLDAEVEKNSKFKLLGARVMFYGICPECQALEINQTPT
jgi:Fur family peroxide stress response transcriptional regulator